MRKSGESIEQNVCWNIWNAANQFIRLNIVTIFLFEVTTKKIHFYLQHTKTAPTIFRNHKAWGYKLVENLWKSDEK